MGRGVVTVTPLPPTRPPPLSHPSPLQVGQVLEVRPSLQQVEVECEVNDVTTVIPTNSVVGGGVVCCVLCVGG